jgi:hypothetical protein
MALDTRSFAKFLLIGALAPLGACSSDDSAADSTGGGGSAGAPVDASRAGSAGTTAGSGGSGGRIDSGAAGTSAGGTAGALSEGGAGSVLTDAGSTPADADAAGPPVCTTPRYSHTSTFGSIFDNWSISPYSGFQASTDPDTGAMTGAVLALDTDGGMPDNGSIRLTIPFSGPQQQFMLAQGYAPGVNMSGSTITAQIRVDSGLNATPIYAGEAFFVVKTGAGYVYADGPRTTLDRSAGWQTISINVDAPSPTLPPFHNPCDVREVDLIIQTPAGFIDLPDASTYTTAVIHLDTIAVAPTTPGGLDGSSAGDEGDASTSPRPDANPDASGDASSEAARDASVDAAGQ